VNEPDLELMKEAMTLRGEARRFAAVEEEERAATANIARVRALAATRMLLAAFVLIRQLTDVYEHAVVGTRDEIDSEKRRSEEESETWHKAAVEINKLQHQMSQLSARLG
jgi:hypothetical protein